MRKLGLLAERLAALPLYPHSLEQGSDQSVPLCSKAVVVRVFKGPIIGTVLLSVASLFVTHSSSTSAYMKY